MIAVVGIGFVIVGSCGTQSHDLVGTKLFKEVLVDVVAVVIVISLSSWVAEGMFPRTLQHHSSYSASHLLIMKKII